MFRTFDITFKTFFFQLCPFLATGFLANDDGGKHINIFCHKTISKDFSWPPIGGKCRFSVRCSPCSYFQSKTCFWEAREDKKAIVSKTICQPPIQIQSSEPFYDIVFKWTIHGLFFFIFNLFKAVDSIHCSI